MPPYPVWFRVQWLGVVSGALFVAWWSSARMLTALLTIYLVCYLRYWHMCAGAEPTPMRSPAMTTDEAAHVLRSAIATHNRAPPPAR